MPKIIKVRDETYMKLERLKDIYSRKGYTMTFNNIILKALEKLEKELD